MQYSWWRSWLWCFAKRGRRRSYSRQFGLRREFLLDDSQGKGTMEQVPFKK
jgi:hypothetical protein